MPKLTGRTKVSLIVFGLVLALALGAGAAKGALIYDFGELLESGYTTQSLSNNSSGREFTVYGQTPVLNYEFGFLNESGHVVGYLRNPHPSLRDLLGGAYNGDPNVPGYENVLNVGEKPYNMIVIEDTDEDGIIGDLTGGVFTVDSGDRSWLTNDIEFNGVAGAISEMPAYTGTSDTLVIPDINLIPEPTTLILMAVGTIGLLRRKSRL